MGTYCEGIALRQTSGTKQCCIIRYWDDAAEDTQPRISSDAPLGINADLALQTDAHAGKVSMVIETDTAGTTLEPMARHRDDHAEDAPVGIFSDPAHAGYEQK